MSRKREPYTIYKRQPQGIYYVRYPDQKRRTGHSTGKTNRSDAKAYVLTQLRIRGELEFSALITLGEFTKDFFIEGKCHWLEEKKKKGKEKSKDSIQQNRGHLMNYIYPQFSERVFTSITAAEIDVWLAQIERASKTKNNILDTMKIIWDEGIKAGVCRVNVVDRIEKYKVVPKSRSAF